MNSGKVQASRTLGTLINFKLFDNANNGKFANCSNKANNGKFQTARST